MLARHVIPGVTRAIFVGVAAALTIVTTARAQAPSATIHRDAWGVPHVFSDTDAGAVFGMAWALAEDDWPLIEENYLRALGRSAELSGEAAVPGDWMARALRIVPLSITEYQAATPRMRALLDAFAAGMNRWLSQRNRAQIRVLDRIEVKLARMTEGGWFDQWDAMIRARDLAAWKTAYGTLRVAYMNTMYADADGNIGYVYGSAVPRRRAGINPSGILDGSDPNTEWQGFHAFEELPQVWNPATGWLLNTNSTPFTATTGLTTSRADFPAYMVGPETDNPRAVSSRRVLSSLRDVTFDDFARLVWDTRLSEADTQLPLLFAEFDALPATPERQTLAPVVERLRTWNRTADTASIETTWFVFGAERRMAAERANQRRTRPHTEALTEALRLLERTWGTRDVAWGKLNRHQRPLPGAPPALDTTRASLAVGGASGGLGAVFTFDGPPFTVATPRIGRGGNSFVKVIEFGPNVRAASILNYGQSGDPASSHFFDQAALYARRQFKPAWFSRAAVEANAVRSYTVR